MINRVIIQKALAIVAALALVVGTVQLVTLLVRPATADASTTGQHVPRNHGPIGHATNDPWTENFPRTSDTYHRAKLTNNRVALVFDFEAGYTWETMGGKYKHWQSDYEDRNYDQANKIMDMLEHLRGAPVSVGVYTFHRAKEGKQAHNNTPNLKATSLENHEGYAKVMTKLGTLDATDGNGERPTCGDGSNIWWGLKQVYDDMVDYENEFQARYHEPADQPLYNNVILFTVANPAFYGENDIWSPVRGRKDALDMALKIHDKGAHLRLMGMGPGYYNGPWKRGFLKELADKTGGSVTTLKHDYGGYTDDFYHYEDPDTYPQYNDSQRKKVKDACNALDPSQETVPAYLDGQKCNHVRDGKFADTVENYLFMDPGVEITADAVDENLVYLNPIADTKFGVTANGLTKVLSTGTDGIIEKRTEGVNNLRIVPRPDKDKYALTRLRLRDGKYSKAKLPKEANARCVGFSRQKYPTAFTPTTFAPGTDSTNRGGIEIEKTKLDTYTYIKCGFYHRPMQESVLRKSVKVGNEQIRFDVLKSKFNIDWSCRDPYAIEDPDAAFT